MKKLILSGLAFFAFGFVHAQDPKGADSGMHFGVKAGANFTNLDADYDTEGRTGFYFGGFLDFPVAENFHVQPELLYSMEGADDTEFLLGSLDTNVDYLRVPIMAKYYVMQGLSIQAGPEVAFEIGGDSDDIMKSPDFGLGIGAGYELPMGVMFDLRYNLGLTNISEGDGTLKNTGFQIGAGYRF